MEGLKASTIYIVPKELLRTKDTLHVQDHEDIRITGLPFLAVKWCNAVHISSAMGKQLPMKTLQDKI